MLDISEAYELRDSYVHPDQLLLDPANPRIILLTNDEVDFDPERLANDTMQDYILSIVDKEEFHVAEVIRSIRQDGYIPVGNKMIVEKVKNTDKFLVLEGNRRTAAIKQILLDRYSLDARVLKSLEKIPIQELVFTGQGNGTPNQVKLKILGLIHLTGALPWGAMERACYIYRSYITNLRWMMGDNCNFEYSADCARDVGEFLKISIKRVRKELAIFRVFEQLRRDKYKVSPEHYSLLDLAVGTRGINVNYFGLSDDSFEFSRTGLSKFGTLCLNGDSPINNPQEFKGFVRIWNVGTENELSLIESGQESISKILQRLEYREARRQFLDQLMDIRDHLEELILADFRETVNEKKVISEIRSLVNDRLCSLVEDWNETGDDINRDLAFPPSSIDDALRLKLDCFEKPIIEIMKNRPNCTCMRSKLPTYLLLEWGIVTRSAPREKFCALVEKAIGRLLAKGILQPYRAKNDRLRLLK
jgi:hypothetical protein